jgi:copper chaperone CopZ
MALTTSKKNTILTSLLLLLLSSCVCSDSSSSGLEAGSIPVATCGADNAGSSDTMGECPVGMDVKNESPSPADTTSSFMERLQLTLRQVLETRTVPSYFLIWSPGSLQKMIVSSLWLAVVHVYRDFIFGNLHSLLLTSALGSSAVNNLVLPLLSSACCAIQLILNVLGVGCGGFNTYLGPLRPYFLSLLLYLSLAVHPPTTLSGIGVAGLRGGMALLPEAVQFWNTYSSTDNKSLLSSQTLFEGGLQAKVEFVVPTMGCVACVNKINSSLRLPKVVEGNSWLLSAPGEKGGKASVTIAARNDMELEAIIQEVQNSMHKAGFDNTRVMSVDITENPFSHQPLHDATAAKDAKTRETLHPNTLMGAQVKIHWNVPSMSCRGCISEINSAVKQTSPQQIVDVQSWLLDEGGQASVTVSITSRQELDSLVDNLQKAIEAAGFDYELQLESMEFVHPVTASIKWFVPTMTCSDCIETVDFSVRLLENASKHLLSVESHLLESGGGNTVVVLKSVSSLRELESLVLSLKHKIQAEGFDDVVLDSIQWSHQQGGEETANAESS